MGRPAVWVWFLVEGPRGGARVGFLRAARCLVWLSVSLVPVVGLAGWS